MREQIKIKVNFVDQIRVMIGKLCGNSIMIYKVHAIIVQIIQGLIRIIYLVVILVMKDNKY